MHRGGDIKSFFKNKYFGTDGIRGVFGEALNEELCYSAGLAIGAYFGGECVIGRDSRLSGEGLLAAVTEGVRNSPCNVFNAGIIPTPAISHLTRIRKNAFGIMISASHNPPEYNGIKVFGRGGIKLSLEEENKIESLMELLYGRTRVDCGLKGGLFCFDEGREIYLESLCQGKLQGGLTSLDGLKVYLDGAFGAAGNLSAEAFERLGARAKAINDSFDGAKINAGCGALYIDSLSQRIGGESEFDMAFAFDGDADRMACVCGGRPLDGDSVLYSLSRNRQLKDGVVVGTLMSNGALERRLFEDGKKLIRTDVGDKFIAELLTKQKYNLGGEQSGHYIFYPESVSGDGIQAAINLAFAYVSGDMRRLQLTPQKTVSVFAPSKALENRRVKKLAAKHKKRLDSLLIRPSGTEPKIRITAEGDGAAVENALAELAQEIEKKGENQ